MSTEAKTSKYWNPYLGGALLGLLMFGSFVVSGHGLGASGGVNRVVVAVEDLVVSRHVDTTPYIAQMAGGDNNPFDHWTVWVLFGVVMGGFLSGWLNKRIRAETYRGPNISVRTRLLTALAGGVIMGYGARLARGCTSGQALSGGAVMSVGSWAFMIARFAGAYFVAIFVRRLWR